MKAWQFKKVVACLLVVLLVTTSWMSVLAESYGSNSGIESSSMFNDELLQFLVNEYGAEQAASLFQTIRDLGLVDGNGFFINHLIYLNGKGYTLDEMKGILADESTDLTQVAEVDGVPISLDTLQKIIAIEDYIELIRQTMDTDDVTITPEHLDSLNSLIKQAGKEGLAFTNGKGNTVTSEVYGSGKLNDDFSLLSASDDYDDEVYITVTKYTWDYFSGHYDIFKSVTLEFQLNEAQTVPVSFSYELMDGALQASQWGIIEPSGTIDIPAGETTATLKISTEPIPPPNWEQTPDSYRKLAWAELARVDYIHFHTFRNFDYMTFDMTVRTINWPVPSLNFEEYKPFSHVYEGGAYLSYALIMGVSGLDSSGMSGLIGYAYYYGIDTRLPTEILEVQARGGTYTTGQILPIQVLYSNPIMHRTQVYNPLNDPMLILANGSVARPEFISWSIRYPSLSFLTGYQTVIAKNTTMDDLKVIKSTGEASSDSYNSYYMYWDCCGHKVPFPETLDKVLPDMEWNGEFSNDPKIEIFPARADVFQSLTLDQASYSVGQTAEVTVNLVNGNGEADWIIDGGTTPEDISKRLKVSIGDKVRGIVQDLDFVRDYLDEPVKPYVLKGTFAVTEELFDYMSDTNRPSGKLRAKIYYNRDAFSSGEEMDTFGLLSDTFAYFTVNPIRYIRDGELAITYPDTWPSGNVNQVFLTDKVATKLGFTFPADATYRTPDQFAWKSSNKSIAEITKDEKTGEAIIIPHQEGKVRFTLTANNNGMLTTEITSADIEIKAGGPPTIVVPDFANIVYVQKNADATILWLTNVMSKYKELEDTGNIPENANFTVDLYEGDWKDTELSSKTPIITWSAPETEELINATSFIIPGEYMKNVSNQYIPSYTVRISTQNPLNKEITLSTLSYIVVKSAVAVITLDKSMGQYITDSTRSLALNWNLANFDSTNKGDFEFKVTKNGVLVPGSLITFDKVNGKFPDDSGVSETGGSYTLTIDPVTDNKHIKDVYAITLAAKNSLDSTWSYDSLYLQVYKSNALHIQIDGVSKTAHTMSNVETIKNMTNDDRVALKRNISLRNEMNINYKDFTDLGEIIDQIQWKSSNKDTGVIYFNSNGKIADIDQFNYSSYQPKHSFILAGIESGKTTISATHAKTGMKTELDVTVNTLRDKLYLFQFYPKTSTTITYTNRKGEEKKFTSNADGELALFDEDGVGSDVYVTSTLNNTTYTGVISYETLLSKEKDAATMELYPINILQLRQLSKAEVFFKTPDGNPYTGKVTYRGGVYKNGNYCDPTEIGGAGITTQLGADGRLEVTLDTTDFYSKVAGEKNAATLSAKDKIDLVFEFTFEGDQYFPQLFTFDGNSNAVDMIVFAEKISLLIANPTALQTPSIVNQYVTDDTNNNKISILTYTGKFGPNNQFPNITLTTEFLWWGEPVDTAAYAELYTEVGNKPLGGSYQTIKYPFSDTIFTRHQQVLNKDTIWLEKAKSGSIHFKLYDGQKEFKKSFISSASLTNMIGVEEIDADELSDMLGELKRDMKQTNANISNPNKNDSMMGRAMELFENLSFDSDSLTMKVMPTDDPLVYKTIITTSFGNLPLTKYNSVEFLKDGKTSLVPGLMDLSRMKNGTYLSELEKEKNKVLNGMWNGKALFSFGGYYVGEVKYNTQTEKWENIVLGGGFNAGGGIQLTRNINQQIGPIPVTFSLTVGGGLEVDFKASVLYRNEILSKEWSNPGLSSVNDYLTSLRVIAYVEAFGGIGFDYSVIAAKIGMFGRVTIENTTSWLNRNYLKDNQTMVGNKLKLGGIVGIKAIIKFLFFSKSWTFASLEYSHSWVYGHWDEIQKYWKEHAASPLTAANMDVAIASYLNYMGIEDHYVFETNTLEDRSYLSMGERLWNTTDHTRFGLMSLDPENAAPKELQTNAYPYANPQLANDGSLFVYLSDGNGTAIEDTVASWAKKVGNSYEDQGPIVTDVRLKGYGDSNLQIAGEDNHIAAVWVRQKDKIEKEAGEEINNQDILMMNNSAEIMAAIYNGTEWKAFRLTDTSNPNLAPVVSMNNGKVFVAYRSVYSSNKDNPLDFSDSDSIVYTVYDASTTQWSDVETLYNGTNGTVMGLSAATLSDGTAAVVYSVNKGNVNQTPVDEYVGGSDNEIIYAVIDTDDAQDASATTWKTKGVVKNLQVTNDTNANENPQITSALFADKDDNGNRVERFIIAWHTTGEENGLVEHDIKLLAVGEDGEIYSGIVDSMNALQSYNQIKIHPNFTFVKMRNADWEIENLSILWKEAEVEFLPDEVVTRDVIKAVKFGIDGEALYLSGAIDVATMPDYTEVDHLSAYVSNATNTEIKALILGTTYTTDTNVVGTIPSGGDGEDIPVTVSQPVSAMYTATETYSNKFQADEILFSPLETVIGYDMPVQFSIVNQGMSKITSVNIDIGGQQTEFDSLTLFPNSSKTLIVPYTVPSLVTDVSYDVTVTFADGQVLSTNGILNLDVPDIGISNVRIVEEVDGKRMLSVPIYNKNDTTLANNGRVVKLGLYNNTIYTDDHLIGNVITISNLNDLNLIDQGGFTKVIEFNLKDYLTSLQLSEIPDNGVTIYLHAWMEDKDGDIVVEFDESNNDVAVSFENLAQKYNKKDIFLLLEQTNDATNTSVDLTLQNMNMAAIFSGNVLLNLLDKYSNIMESKYLATDGSQLLYFGAEEKKTLQVPFDQKGESVQAMFFIENADTLDSTLSAVTLSGVKVNFDSRKTDYQLQTKDLKKTHLYAVASHSESTVTVFDRNGKVIAANKGFVSLDQPLQSSPDGALNEFVLSVQPESASGTATDYRFAIANTSTSQPSLELLVKGTTNKDGKYVDKAIVSLPPYDVNGYSIAKASYSINNGSWTEIAYDGKVEQTLTTISKAGVYTIAAKVQLTSGSEYDLDPVTFEVVTAGGQTPGEPAPESPDNKIAEPKPINPSVPTPDSTTNIFRQSIMNFEKLFSLIKEKLQTSTTVNNLSDIQKHWALAAITKLAKLDVIKGYPDGSFKPDRAITRAEFASMLVRLLAIEDTGANKVAFTDINKNWAMDAIHTLARHGIVIGYSDGTFKPDATITREEIVVMIMRLLHAEALSQTGDSNFTDIISAGNYARESIDAAAKAGIVNGHLDHTFKPKGQATRAEVATILIRLLELDTRLKELLDQL